MKSNRIIVLLLLVFSVFLVGIIGVIYSYKEDVNNVGNLGMLAYNTEDFVYLSDISFINDESFANTSIRLDKNDSKDIIGLKVNDKTKYFIKGITAWANSQIVYDLRDYEYDYFTSYLGVDISEVNNYFNTGVKFYIYGSTDKSEWVELYKSGILTASDNSEFVKLDIGEYDYLKLVADDNSDNWWANWYDEAVYANAKLIKEGYQEEVVSLDTIKRVEE